METRRRKDPKYLQSLLATRINQQKMLNNTLCEMMSKNSNKKSIELIKEEINSIMGEISRINDDIEGLSKKGEECSYSFYDNAASMKEDKKKGFYDSIIKQSKAAQVIEDEYGKKDKSTIEYNYGNIYDKLKNKCDNLKGNKNDSVKEFLDDLRNTVDSRVRINRFLVDLKGSLNIPEIMVKSISFDPNENKVSVCIYDFVTNFNGQKRPILQVLKNAPNLFNFTVKHLEADGKVMYTEKYSRCHLMEIYRDPIDYASDDFSKIQLFISYQNVDYETSE